MRLKSSIVLALMGALLFAVQSSAHDSLIDIKPTPGSVITQPNFEAALTFNNDLLFFVGESNAELATKPVGSNTWTKHEVLISGQVLTANINLTEGGKYDLRWKVVSSDGHPISGSSSFFLDTGANGTSNQTSPAVISPNPLEGVAESERSLMGFYIGLAMVVLGAIFAPIGLLMRRRAKRSAA